MAGILTSANGARCEESLGPRWWTGHTVRGQTGCCMDAHGDAAAESAAMPLDLTDAELATAATACRAMAYQEGKRAEAMENPTMRGPFEANARRYAALAEKMEK